ncbi:MAG: glycerophosphodiester phosphodiesterase family protein [Eubacteriales bacterium]|nr:glycerophosphodiester phosphodiesterase family protein [Eubacteriales bacterium]
MEKPPKKFCAALAILSICILTAFAVIRARKTTEDPIEPIALDIQIVAHRAGACAAPENTLVALETAIRSGADMAEIDIRQTKDHVLVALHDANLKRTTGLERNVWDLDYEKLTELDAGSYFSDAFAGETIPTLNEILKAAKGRIFLMLELKADGSEENMEQEAVSLIRLHEMEEQCSIASADTEMLKTIKTLEPRLQTVYITKALDAGDYELPYVDGYSIKTAFLTEEAAELAHEKQKKIYAWTANRELDVRKILRCRCDGIISDDLEMVENCLHPQMVRGLRRM